MKTWIYLASVSSALCLALACADGDEISDDTDGSGGVDASAGESGEAGGTAAGGAGGVPGNGAAGEGQAGAPAVTCEPPLVGAGGASSGAGGAGSGAGGEAGAVSSPALALAGSYIDNYHSEHRVSSSAWTIGTSVHHIAAFDNAGRWIVAQNEQRHRFYPCLWSRFDWAEVEGVLYYCQTAYDAESQAAALATTAADGANLATGCNGFPWSTLTPQ